MPPVLVGRHSQAAQERAPHRLGGAEARPGRGGGDEQRPGLQQPPRGVDADPLDVVARWAAEQAGELAGEVALAHPDARGQHGHPEVGGGLGVDEVLGGADRRAWGRR